MTRYFVNGNGIYIGGFDGAEPPANAIEVSRPPDHALQQKWNGSAWIDNPAYRAPVPDEISDRQFFQALAVAGLITKDEALAAVMTGAIPASLESFVDALAPSEEFSARMKLSGATTFRRSDELVAIIGALQGMTEDEIDNLWRAAAVL